MLLREFIDRGESRLADLYPAAEARSIVLILCSELLGTESYTHIIEPGTVVPPEKVEALESALLRLAEGEPVQYVVGRAEFFGRSFNVAPGVLIPRPETEELVELALRYVPEGGRVLDLCTGSGCIAWSVALESRAAQVVGVDISDEALDLARSQYVDGRVSFRKQDVLGEIPGDLGKFDLILSNPPYIMKSQKSQMRRNVLDFEPGLALFVPDDDPLRFYKAVGRWCSELLVDGGKAVVEINDELGGETFRLFRDMHFSDVQLINDISGKNRLVIFSK